MRQKEGGTHTETPNMSQPPKFIPHDVKLSSLLRDSSGSTDKIDVVLRYCRYYVASGTSIDVVQSISDTAYTDLPGVHVTVHGYSFLMDPTASVGDLIDRAGKSSHCRLPIVGICAKEDLEESDFYNGMFDVKNKGRRLYFLAVPPRPRVLVATPYPGRPVPSTFHTS